MFESADDEQPRSVLTGDTLFIGDVGRPDLVGSRGFTAEQMAGLLFDSLHQKLLTLPDSTGVYPAHGAGSLCGRSMSKETSSTIGEQRASNYALKEESRDRFIDSVTKGLPEVPRYFPEDVALNRQGAPSLAARGAPRGMSAQQVAALLESGGQLLDVREAGEFLARHVPGSINIGLDGQLASWAGTLLDPDRPLVVLASDADEVEQALLRLSRVGLDRVDGFLEGGIDAWTAAGRESMTLADWSVEQLDERRGDEALQVIDVRRPTEYAAGRIPGAINEPLAGLEAAAARLDRTRPTALICESGYRSSTASSVLERSGFEAIHNVRGGFDAWQAAGLEIERPLVTSTP